MCAEIHPKKTNQKGKHFTYLEDYQKIYACFSLPWLLEKEYIFEQQPLLRPFVRSI